MGKPSYSKPPTQAFAEMVEAEDYVPSTVVGQADDKELSEDGYVNVSAEYRNYANATDKPRNGDEGAESDIEDRQLADDVDPDKGATPEVPEDAEEDEENDEDEESDSNPFSTPLP